MIHAGDALCAALRDDGRHPSAIDLAALSPAEWHRVAMLGVNQRVGPLLFARRDLPMPAEVRAMLRTRVEHVVRRGLLQQAAFRELIGAIAPLDIQVLALKGLHLSTSVYSNPSQREMVDLDVLVPAAHLDAVADVTRQLGYQVPSTGVCDHHLAPRIRGRVAIEIHFRLAQGDLGLRADVDGLRRRAIDLPGIPGAKGLCPEDLLLHICMHAAEHHVLEMGLRALCDVRAILARYGDVLDWRVLIDRSREWKTERGMALILALAQHHLGVPVPRGVMHELRAAVPDAAMLESATRLMMEDAVLLTGTSDAARQLFALPDTRARLRHIATYVARPATRPPGEAPARAPWWSALPGVIGRARGLMRRHGRWLWRAYRDRSGRMRTAMRRHNVLADWIRYR